MDQTRERLERSLGAVYRVEREIGGGGMSRVFLATESALDRRVVLKILPPELAASVPVERFRREIAVAARLQHPHIVPLLAAGDAEGIPWFSMPFVEGESLRARLAHGELPVSESVRTMRAVASALAYAHAHGVMHRDIKPDNVMLTPGGAMVTDFGIARALSEAGGVSLTSTGIALGTPAYMSPEQCAGDVRVDHRTDLYALGMLGYEMLTGRNPFSGRTAQATFAAHMSEAPAPIEISRPSSPPALVQLINRCLAKAAADRPQSAEEVVNALDAIATPSGSASLAPASAVAFPPARKAWWRRPPVAGAGAIALLAVIAAVATYGRGSAGDADATFDPNASAGPVVAVVPFENLTGDTSLALVGDITAVELASGVLQAGQSVVDLAAIRSAIGASETVPSDLAARLARERGATLVVTGSYTVQGDGLRLQGVVTDVRSDRVVFRFDPETGPRSDPMIVIAKVRDRLLGGLVTSDASRSVTVTLRPPVYAAAQEYQRALRERDCPARLPGLRRAIAIDSAYVDAYQEFSLCMNVSVPAQWDELASMTGSLESRRANLSSFDQLRVDYLRARVGGELDEALDIARRLYDFTRSPAWAFEAGRQAIQQHQPRLAIRYLELSDSSNFAQGHAGQFEQLSRAHHHAEDYRAELAVLERASRAVPGRDWRAKRAIAYAGLGDTLRVEAIVDSILASIATQQEFTAAVNIQGTDLAGVANELAVHQQDGTLRRVTERVRSKLRQLESEYERSGRRVNFENQISVWFRFDGNIDSLQMHARRGTYFSVPVRSDAPVSIPAQGAIVAAMIGDTVRARAVADSIIALDLKWGRGQPEYWRAAILAQLGERDEAVRLLRVSLSKGNTNADWHRSLNLRALRGYPPFEALLRPER